MTEDKIRTYKKTIIDIGARGGIISMFPDGTNRFLAPILANNARIVQFEPNHSYSIDRISSFFGCELINKAVGLKPGAATLYITKDPYKSSILEPNSAEISKSFLGASNQYLVADKIEVECVAINDIISEYANNTEIWLKIDAQGLEGGIIKSIGAEMCNINVIIVELSSIEQYIGQVVSQEVIPELFNLGFNLLFSNYKSEAPYENDFIFIRAEELTPTDTMHLHLLVGNIERALALAPNFAARVRLRALLTLNAVALTIIRSGVYALVRGLLRNRPKD